MRASSIAGFKTEVLPYVKIQPLLRNVMSLVVEGKVVLDEKRKGLTHAWHSIPNSWHTSMQYARGSQSFEGALPRVPVSADDQGS